ncbi:MAG TPA: glycosyltransferase family 4 protein [Candidatus Woesebacteria bacterium]|mgnify:CR=1 FL=1|nr:glycosyltransferase family 4 protein [Candidatus Woesebacteria bacterium]
MKISIIRGAFLNPFELQNYNPLKEAYEITAISSKHPISDKIDLPLIKLWSPTDLPNFPYKFPILNRLFGDAQKLNGLEKIIKGSDIVHVAETYYGYTHQAIMAKRRGLVRRIVSTVWEIIPHNNEGLKGRNKYKRESYENIDQFLAVTEKAKQALIKEGVNSEKIKVINIGIDIHRFVPSPKKKKKTINILCVARLVPEKGITDLLEAFLQIRKNNSNVHLTFVGNGPLKQDLIGYKNVSIKSVPYSQIVGEYQKADIFCLPSRETKTWQEQYGMCLLEAMACGLPIVTTNSGAIPEVCGEAALISHYSNITDLKAYLEELIYNETHRKQLSKIARKMAVQKYDHRKISRQIENVYREIACR